MKICTKCGIEKELNYFDRDKNRKDGLYPQCKQCIKIDNFKINHSEVGKLKLIYKTQKYKSKKRGHISPNYTLEQLIEFAYKNNYKELYNNWKNSGYLRDLAPSFDRLDDYKGYCLTRLKLVIWEENNNKGHEDRKKGINNKINKSIKSICCITGNIKVFHSLMEAQRQTGISNQSISLCCLGKAKSAGKYFWEFIK